MGRDSILVIVLRRCGAIPQPLGGGDRMGELFASSKNLLRSLEKTLRSFHVRYVFSTRTRNKLNDIHMQEHGFLTAKYESEPEVREVFVRDFVDVDEDAVVLNAREQFRMYVSRNYRVALGSEAEDVSKWTVSRRLKESMSGVRSIRTALDVFRNSSFPPKGSWTRFNSQQHDSRYLDTIRRGKSCEVVLFRGNHASPVLSKRCETLIRNWNPDTVVLETCNTRLCAMMFPPKLQHDLRMRAALLGTLFTFAFTPDLVPFAFIASYLTWARRESPDMRVALEAARDVGADVVLADWESTSRSKFDRVARTFDSVQYANQADTNGVVFYSALSQIFFPSLTPRITSERWALWRSYEREKHPHTHWIFEARNDLITSTIESICSEKEEVVSPHPRRVVVVLGAAHCESILDRLTGAYKYDSFFDRESDVVSVSLCSRDYDDVVDDDNNDFGTNS